MTFIHCTESRPDFTDFEFSRARPHETFIERVSQIVATTRQEDRSSTGLLRRRAITESQQPLHARTRKGDSIMAREKIRVGIIGANAHYGWGSSAHIPALKALPEFEITAVCTSRQETADE